MLAVAAERPCPRTSPAWLESGLAPEPVAGWPLLAASVPAGFPAPADDFVECRLSLNEHLIRNPENTFLVRVAGDELAGASIHDGDLLVMDRSLPPTNGSLVLAMVDGSFALGRLGRDSQGRRVLQSAHPECPDRPLGDDPAPMIWGVVRWVIHRAWPGREWVS